MKEMKQAWKTNYPGELLTDDSTPGPRYWTMTYSVLQPGRAKRYVPWTKITSNMEEEAIECRRAGRTPRSELQSVLDSLFEGTVELGESEITSNPWKYQKMENGEFASAYVGLPTPRAYGSWIINSWPFTRTASARRWGFVPLPLGRPARRTESSGSACSP